MNVFDNTYDVNFACRNCGETGKLNVPKGTKLEDMPCPICGCKTLISTRTSA
jgi:hypothetical protein